MEAYQNIHTCIDAAKKGNTNAFMQLVKQYERFVFTIAVKITGNRVDAEDITQEVFVKVFKAIGSFKEKSEFSTWLYRIAYTTTLSELRKKRVSFVPYDAAIHNDFDDESVFESTTKEQLLQCLENVIEELPPDEAYLIYLFYTAGQSLEQVSQITDLSLSNVKVKLHRIRQKMKVELYKKLR